MMKQSNKKTPRGLLLVIGLVLVALVALGAWMLLGGSETKINEVPTEEVYDYVNPDETKAQPDAGFVIDGVLDEAAYQKNNWLYLHNEDGGNKVDIAMTSYFGEKGMYFVYDVTESVPIYVNLDRASYLNSCIEMYFAPSSVTTLSGNSVFEVDLLPTGDMVFKQANGKGGYVGVATTDDVMAYLGATTKGGDVNTDSCYGYCLELFIPWDYMQWLGMDVEAMKESFVYVNPAHITSNNFSGTDTNVDRYWYFYAQQHGASFGNVYQYFRFDENGALGTVATNLTKGDHYTISGPSHVIPGMLTTVTITPEQGYALNSVKVNGQERIQSVSYNEDGSVTLNVRGDKNGLTISAGAEKVTEGNKTLSGAIKLHNLSPDALEGALISYTGPDGEKLLTVDADGKFELKDLKQGYYTINVEKKGYRTQKHGIYLSRDINAEISLEFETFYSESGNCWILDDQNDGVIHKFGGQGFILTNAAYNDFTFEANFKYFESLNQEKTTTTHFTEQRSGMRIRFSNGKYWNINLLKQNGEYILQYASRTGSVFTKYHHICTLSAEQVAKYTGEEGISLRVVRDGQYASVYLDGELMSVENLGDEYAELTAQLGFEAWVANREIMDIPFTITGKALTDVQNSSFYKPNGWVITGQYDGVLLVDGSEKSNWLNFGKKYVNMDLTLNAKDYIGNNTPLRLVVAMNFENGKNATFSITYSDGEYKLQAMGDSVFGWRNFYKLTEEEIAKFQSKDGIDFRIVRIGTEVSLYLDGKEVCSGLDLTGKDSGITADMPATVAIRHYGNVGHTVEIPFEMTDDFVVGTITIVDSKNGGIVVSKHNYIVGETITVSDAGIDGYYCTGLKVNGKAVSLNWDGTYSLKTTKQKYTVEGSYSKAVFKNNPNWDLLEQNNGVITRHDGIGEGWLEMWDTYKDLDITMTLKGVDETSAGGVRLIFKNDTIDEWATFRIVCEKGVWKLKSMNDSVFWWADFYKLTQAQVDKYLSDEGIQFRVVRKGTDVYLYLDGQRVCDTIDLTVDHKGNATGITADMEAVVRVRHYGTTGQDIDIPFTVKNKVEAVNLQVETSENGELHTQYRSYLIGDSIFLKGIGKDNYYCCAMALDGNAVELATNGTYTFTAEKNAYTVSGTFDEGTFVYDSESGWDVRNQNVGIVALPNGGNGGWLEFYNKYTDVDITLNVRDYADGEKDPRTELLFTFDVDGDGVYTDAHVTYGVIAESANNKAFIQSIPVKNQGTNVYGSKYPNHGDLTAEEYAAFNDGGITLRVVRCGTDIHLYIGDRKVNVKDLTQNGTGIQADTKMRIYIRHYDDNGVLVEIPFTVTDQVEPVEVTVNTNENGTIVTNFQKYLKNDTVVLFGKGKDNYYCNAIKINGEAAQQHWSGSYTFEATESSYAIDGQFVKGLFVYNDGWDLLKQNEGKIVVKYTNANGNANWLDFYDKYTDMDVTLNVREYPDDVKGALTRSAIRFTFDNGEIITFSIAKNKAGGSYKYSVQTLNGDTIVEKDHDFYVMNADEIAALNSESGIDFRVIKNGTKVDIYFGNVKVAEDIDLTAGDSGVTADMAAKVSIRRYDDPNIDAEYTVNVSTELPAEDKVILSIDNAEHGSVTSKWQSHIVGENVTLIVAPEEGYYCKSFTVTKDGVAVALNGEFNIDGGEYTFTAEEGTYTVNAVFEKKVFVTNSGWDLLQQSSGVVALPNGGNGGWLEFINKYTDMDITLNVQDYAAGNGYPRTDLLLVFENGAHVSFGITCDSTHAWIQSLNQVANDGKQIYDRFASYGDLTADEFADFINGGVAFRVVRKGTDIHLYIGDRKVNVVSLTNNSSGVTAETEMTVYIRHYDDSGVRVEIPFEVSNVAPDAVNVTVNGAENGQFKTQLDKYLVGDYVVVIPNAADGFACSGLSINGLAIDKLDWNGTHIFHATADSYTVSGSFKEEIFADHDNWNTVNQHFGQLATNVNGDTGYLETNGNYNQLTLFIKDPGGNMDTFRVEGQLVFANGKLANVQVFKYNGHYYIKSEHANSILGTNQDLYRIKSNDPSVKDIYQKIQSEGVKLTVVRVGTNLVLYIDGVRLTNLVHGNGDYIDLTVDNNGNSTGITADMAVKMQIRSRCKDAEYTSVVIPFELTEEQPAYSTVVISNMTNGTVTVDKKVYLPGDTVTLTVTPAEGYFNKSLAVSSGSNYVTLGEALNIEGGKYTFVVGAGNHTYIVDAGFVDKVFVTGGNWNLVDQDEGKLSNTVNGKVNATTGYVTTVGYYNQFTITIHDPSGSTENNYGVAGQFEFENGKIVNIQVFKWNNKYYIKSANNSSIFGGNQNYYVIGTDHDLHSKITGEGIELTVVRAGTDLILLADGKRLDGLQVGGDGHSLDISKDINGSATGITADMKAKVSFASWCKFSTELSFELVVAQPDYSVVTVGSTENGTITVDKRIYLAGETVTLTVTPNEGYYCKFLAVNNGGANVALAETLNVDGGKYTFVVDADNRTYTVGGAFAKKVFTTGGDWNLVDQDVGKIYNATNGNTGYVTTVGNYNQFTIIIHDPNGSVDGYGVAGQFEFENGKIVNIQVTKWNGKYYIKSANSSSIFGGNQNYIVIGTDHDLHSKITGEGIELTVMRAGTDLILLADGKRLDGLLVGGDGHSLDISKDINGVATGITADMKAKVSFASWCKSGIELSFELKVDQPAYYVVNVGSTENGTITTDKRVYLPGETATLTVAGNAGYAHNSFSVNGKEVMTDLYGKYSFVINEDATASATFAESVFKSTVIGWLFENQHYGLIAADKSTGNSSWGDLAGEYGDIDITLTAKEFESTNELARTLVRFMFKNGKTFSVSIAKNKANGEYEYTIESIGGNNLEAAGYDYYTLTEDEVAKYTGDEGIKFRVVRSGTKVYVYLDDVMVVSGYDLTKGGTTGITADTKMTVTIRQYDTPDVVAVFKDFCVKDYAPSVTLTIADTTNGTVTANKQTYKLGETVNLTVAGNAGYAHDSLTVGGKSVVTDLYGKYSFDINEDIVVDATFAKSVFKSTVTGWLLENQHYGQIAADESTGNSSWGDLADEYGDIDITLTTREFESTNELARTLVRFMFKNGKTFSVSIAKNKANGEYEYTIESIGNNNLEAAGYDYYTLTEDEVAKYTGDEGIKFRVVRSGTKVYVYLDDVMVVSGYDLTKGGTTGITADTKMTVTIRQYDTPNVVAVFEDFCVKNSAPVVNVNIADTTNGKVTADKQSYKLGDTVTLTATPNSGYFFGGLYVDGKLSGKETTYSFTATEESYDVSAVFGTSLFVDNGNYDLSKQLLGVISQKNTVTGNASWLFSNRTDYKDVEVAVTIKPVGEGDTKPNGSRISIQFGHKQNGNDFWTSFSVLQSGSTYTVTNRNGDNVPFTTYTLTADEVAQINNGGIVFRVVKKGTTVNLYLGEKLVVANIDLTKGGTYSYMTADTPVQVKFKIDDNPNATVELPFSIIE